MRLNNKESTQFIDALNNPPEDVRGTRRKYFEYLDKNAKYVGTGYWIIEGYENEISCCSNCHAEFPINYELDAAGIKMNYCPNCGADMKGELYVETIRKT